MTFLLVLPLSSTLHTILPLCLLQPFPVEPCQARPPLHAQETSNPVAGMSLPSMATTSDFQLYTVSNFKLLKKKKPCCNPQQKKWQCRFPLSYVVHIMKSLFSFSCLASRVFLCLCTLLYVYTECVEGRFGADCQQQCECENGGQCDRQTGQCSCSAGWIGEHCEKGEPVSLCCTTVAKATNLQKPRPHGNCCAVETVGLAMLCIFVNYNLQFAPSLLSMWTGPVRCRLWGKMSVCARGLMPPHHWRLSVSTRVERKTLWQRYKPAVKETVVLLQPLLDAGYPVTLIMNLLHFQTSACMGRIRDVLLYYTIYFVALYSNWGSKDRARWGCWSHCEALWGK